MTDATYFPTAAPRSKSVDRCKPKPFAAPLFIGDAVTPLAGETVLSLLWKRMDDDDQ